MPKGDERTAHGHHHPQSPNVMWGTDGTRILTVDDGYVWPFTAVEHWNRVCLGWHVAKYRSRYAAVEPISMGLGEVYGNILACVGRGLSLRLGHRTQYLSDHFLNRAKYWDIQPSFAFVSQPESNGVAESCNRTLKEQPIYGRVFENIGDVRIAVREFFKKYNQQWLVAKLGYR